jgi:hypothetical protein
VKGRDRSAVGKKTREHSASAKKDKKGKSKK